MTERLDALFVIHQDVTLAAIAEKCRGLRSIAVLTTHKLFATEERDVRRLCERVEIATFSDLLDDASLVACDEQATRELAGREDIRAYDAEYRAIMLRLKNRLAHDKLSVRYELATIYYADGLGVNGAYWSSRGAVPLVAGVQTSAVDLARQILTSARGEREMLPDITVVDGRYVFLGSIKRLRLRGEYTPSARSFGIPRAVLRTPKLAAAVLRARLRDIAPDWQPCTTIHEYRPVHSALAAALDRELLIFVDGYHPSNYPRAYLDMYASGTFVAPALPSARWFEQFGRRVLPPLAFQQSEQFGRCEPRTVKTVLLVMNHAGDWTALINRSDTDALIAAFADFARARGDINFVLRLHPTMATPAHEGVHSIERVRRFIEDLRLPNLVVSNASLEEDLARAELYLSEYSQVLIDAWRGGRLGVAVNLTGRRSFMADYERFGFPAASSVAELHSLIDRPVELAEQQNRAVDELNARQRAWEMHEST